MTAVLLCLSEPTSLYLAEAISSTDSLDVVIVDPYSSSTTATGGGVTMADIIASLRYQEKPALKGYPGKIPQAPCYYPADTFQDPAKAFRKSGRTFWKPPWQSGVIRVTWRNQ